MIEYIIPAGLTLLVGILLWLVQRERLNLDYEVISSERFPSGEGTGRYFIVRLRNSGNRKIESIDFSVSLAPATIESASASDSRMLIDVSQAESSYQAKMPLLNPREMFSLTITTKQGEQSSPPKVSARAPGVTAVPRPENNPYEFVQAAVVTAAAAAAVTATFGVYSTWKTARVSDSLSTIENLGEVSERIEKSEESFQAQLRKLTEEREQFAKQREEGEPETEQILFAIFNRVGLADKFPRLVGSSSEVQYWKTGLFLMNAFLVDEINRDKYIAAAELLVEVPAVAPSSRGFNYYLLSKMEEFRGRSERAVHWLELCREKAPRMYQHLMAQDPAYDLETIQRALREEAPE